MGSRVIECKTCKHLFQSFGSAICPVCVEEMEKNFEIVKEYIYNNPGANIIEITKETGVTEKSVLYYLKEGRLSVEGAESELVCEKCKKPISSGRFCKDCQITLENTLYKSYVQSKQSIAEEARKALQGRMHVER
jgi:uncharacterized protein